MVFSGTSWILGQAVQVHCSNTEPTIDWNDHSYGVGAFVFCLWGFSDPLVSTYLYWLVGNFSNDLNETSFLAAIINSMGSLGSTFGFVASAKKFNYNSACALNLALFFSSIPGLAWVVFTKVANTTHETNISGGSYAAGSASEDGQDITSEKYFEPIKTGVQSTSTPL